MRVACFCLLALVLIGCGNSDKAVTVYASQDRVYAEPILTHFTKQTGIRVRAIYDSEAVKTVGLVNRLIAEQANPQCDVFWNNEELRTRQLEKKGIVDRWASVGFRSRRIVVNTNLVVTPPASLVELTNSTWKGKVALAYPLFGTTATHFLVLRQQWGPHVWERWCRALRSNNPILVDGNSVVVQMVGRGEAAVGLTDSDDIAAGQRQGMPIRASPGEENALLIPNTVALVRKASPRPEADRLFEYLQSEDVHKALVNVSALEEFPSQKAIKVDWSKLLEDIELATATLKQVFLR